MFRHRAVRRAVVLALGSSLLVAGCSSDEEPAAAPAPTTEAAPQTPSPTPTPTRTLRPVVGERTTNLFPLGSRPVLGLGANPEPDRAAVERAVELVGKWLDKHLDSLQRDGGGAWEDMAAKGLANPKQRRLLTGGLAAPSRPVASARYLMSIYHDGPPRYMAVRVEVTHDDAPPAAAGLVFVLADDGTPTLTMFGPEVPAEVAG